MSSIGAEKENLLMKIALAVPCLYKDVSVNIDVMNSLISEACANGASFLLFPEATITGLINSDVYEHDINISIPLNHKIIVDFCNNAKENSIWLCFGFLENDNGCIYDSAVLINPNGKMALHYRRINPQWRAKNLPASQYSEGVEMKYTLTPLGTTAIVICGDLFDDNVIAMLKKVRPNFVLFPFARCFNTNIENVQKEWDETEEAEYINRAKLTGGLVAMTNYIGTEEINDTSFGGAFVVSSSGELLASLHLLQEGLLYYDFGA